MNETTRILLGIVMGILLSIEYYLALTKELNLLYGSIIVIIAIVGCILTSVVFSKKETAQ